MATTICNARAGYFSHPKNNIWSCPACSFDNPLATYPHCNMCNQSTTCTSINHLDHERSTVVWQCPQCTLINKIEDDHCEACDYVKPKNHNPMVLVNSTVDGLSTSVSLSVHDRRHKDETDAEYIFQHIINYCKKVRTHFVDDRFVPSSTSIGTDSFQDISQWLRIADISPLYEKDRSLPLTIFSSPQPTDIQQGALGNCWLIAALALISEQPRLLEHILLTKTVNKEGVYLIRICHNGLWKTIIVDDCFPCTKHKRLVFSQAKRRQLYVPLIEKACAKVFGSYASLRSGNMREGLQLLTGAPCDHIDLHPSNGLFESDIVWAKLLSACESKLLIGVSTGGTGISREEYAREHIHANHAFSILAAHTLDNDPAQFVLVRDPHSRSRYTEDALTTTVLKQLRLVNPARRSTGAFWISWSRFLRYFSSITISTYKSSDFDVREAGKFTRSSTEDVTSYRFYVPKTSMVNISLLYHRLDRTTPISHTQSFVLCDIDKEKTLDSIGQNECILMCKRGGLTCWSGPLRAGYYVLIPFSISFWRETEKNNDYTIVIHSNVQLSLTIESKPATFLADCLIAALIKVGERKQEKEAVFYKTSSKVGMKIFIAENSSVAHHLTVDISMEVAENVRHSRRRVLPYNTHDSIPPRYRQLIFITEWTEKNSRSTYLSYSCSYKHETKMIKTLPIIDNVEQDLHLPRAF